MQVTSPVSLTKNTRLKNTIPSQVIIDLYKNDLGVDVHAAFTGIESVSIYECLDTGYLFYHPDNLSGNERFYDDLKRQMPVKYNVPYYSETKWEYEVCSKLVKKEDKVYEIGAGSGAFLNKLKQQGVAGLFGSELNLASIESALQRGIQLEYKTIEARADETVAEFDIVCSFQVLEHVEKVNSFLSSALKILKPGGKLIIAVPYNNPYLFKHDMLNTLNLPPHHMGLWNRKAFENLPKYYPVRLTDIIIEQLPSGGYDFDRYLEINKPTRFYKSLPFKKYFDRLYKFWLSQYHNRLEGKNIIAVFTRNEAKG